MGDTPSTIHRYEIEGHIGEGGMGALYLARDPVLDRLVAIKLLREGFDNPDLRERFIREAKSVARLTHVNIVRIFDFGEHEGQPFIAMEYLPGETLADKIRRRAQIPLSERLRYMEDLCAGLAHAHKAQIVHRDIKPANVMISPEGELKILDFGIARLGDSRMTQAGMLVGTLNYMSPEQLAGGQVDQRSDIFAVGALFYELLAYRQAFPGGLHDGLLHRILHVDPEPIDRFCPDLDPEIGRIILQALEKDQARRYASLTDMGREIARVRDWLPSEATQVIPSPDAATMAIPAPRPSDSGRPPRPTPPPERQPSPAERTVTVPTPMPAATAPKPPLTDAQALEQRRASEIRSLLDAGEKAFDEGKYAEAIGAAEAVLVRDPEHGGAIALAGRARRARQAAAAQSAADAALVALASGHIEVAERHIAEGAAADTDHPAVLAAHVKVKEARVAAEAERARRAAADAEREKARALEAQRKREADEARRREDEARQREQAELRRREEADLARRRDEETQRRRDAEAAAREQQVQEQLRAAEAALGAAHPDEALAALARALEIDPNARVGALQVRTEALREELARAEEGRRQREREQRRAAARERLGAIARSRAVHVAAGALVLALAAAVILPRLRDVTPTAGVPAPAPTTPTTSVDSTPAPRPPGPAPAGESATVSALSRARTLYAEGRRVEALQLLRKDDPALAGKAARGIADIWLHEARLSVASSAERALKSGARSTSPQYRDATARRAAAEERRQQGRLAESLQAYWQAQQMYDALQPGKSTIPTATDPSPSTTGAKPDPPPSGSQPQQPPAAPPVTTPLVQPSPQPRPTEPVVPAPNPQAEREAVLRTVYEFAAAMNARDAAAVMRLRRMDAQEQKLVADLAKNLIAYTHQLTPTGAPTVDGNRATVRCVRQQSFVDAARRRRTSDDAVMIELLKEGDRWIITAVIRQN